MAQIKKPRREGRGSKVCIFQEEDKDTVGCGSAPSQGMR